MLAFLSFISVFCIEKKRCFLEPKKGKCLDARDEDRAHSNFSTALADKEEGEESLSQSTSPKRGEPASPSQCSETSSPTSEPSSTESDDEGETASCATHSPVYSPCPSLSDEPDESENEYVLPERTVEYSSWNPTPQWGTEYNWTQEYRDNEKRIANEWAVAAVARKRVRRDESMSGGASPPRKDADGKKKFLMGKRRTLTQHTHNTTHTQHNTQNNTRHTSDHRRNHSGGRHAKHEEGRDVYVPNPRLRFIWWILCLPGK
jgi:hypothetical protein